MILFIDHLRHVPTTPENIYFSRLPAMVARLLRSSGAEDRWSGQEWRCTRIYFLPSRPTFDLHELVSCFKSLAKPGRQPDGGRGRHAAGLGLDVGALELPFLGLLVVIVFAVVTGFGRRSPEPECAEVRPWN